MKRLYTVIFVLVVLLGFGFYQEKQPYKISRDHTPTVGILQLTEHPALDAIHKGIIDGLNRKRRHVYRYHHPISASTS